MLASSYIIHVDPLQPSHLGLGPRSRTGVGYDPACKHLVCPCVQINIIIINVIRSVTFLQLIKSVSIIVFLSICENAETCYQI